MKIYITGDTDGLKPGIQQIAKYLDIELSDTGLEIQAERHHTNKLCIEPSEDKVIIRYRHRIHFFRGLGLIVEQRRQGQEGRIEETIRFTTNGVMMDCSRNAVPTVDSIKRMLDAMALMGLNMMMLYTEDVYEIGDLPYFGYMRGRYTEEELRACDDYAHALGIEMIPCIQTLAHLAATLKWQHARGIKDTADILLVGEPKTYEFIDTMIRTASSCFRSKRIHIGMDEAHQLGLGEYLTQNGLRDRFDIMTEHLEQVCKITRSYDLQPMMWSDMFFRLGSQSRNDYDPDAEIAQEVIDKIPEDVELVYWDYVETDQDYHEKMIQRHQSMDRKMIFAGGVWTWNRLNTHYEKTFMATHAALQACKVTGVDEVFMTIWANSSGEVNWFQTLLGLQLNAEHGYHETVTEEHLRTRFKTCTGQSYDAFMDLTKMDSLPGEQTEKLRSPSNATKILLWQDVLTGLYDKHIENRNLARYYGEMESLFAEYAEAAGEFAHIFEMNFQLARVLKIKGDLGVRIKESYDREDREALKQYAETILPKLLKEVRALQDLHRTQWMDDYKPFGWEIHDFRYGALLARLETAKIRLTQYINGTITSIEELEQERLYYDGPERPAHIGFGYAGNYQSIISVNGLG